MGIEMPRVIPAGLHPKLKSNDSSRRLKAGSSKIKAKKTRDQSVDVDIRETIKNLEKVAAQFNRRFDISVNESINRIVVKVIDTQTDKIVKEIPPREIQHLLARLYDMIGLFVNESI